MTNPLNSSDFTNLEGVDKEIQTFISQIEEGKAPNPEKLLKIENELKNLINNQNIPESVKKTLKSALEQLSTEESSGKSFIGLSGLYGAKSQVDQAIEEGKQQQ